VVAVTGPVAATTHVMSRVLSPVQQQPLHPADPRIGSLRRTTLTFRLSGPDIQRDLLHEFALHRDVIAHALNGDGTSKIAVQTLDTPAAVWDVRATISMFDDHAEELESQ